MPQTDSIKEHIQTQISRYCDAITHAEDLSLAEQVWHTDDRASLIFPLGEILTWQNICTDFFGKVMTGMFSQRKLHQTSQAVIEVLDDNTVIALFDWKFEAVRREDGQSITTQGRETQVYQKDPQGLFKIIHVHYSQLPAA